MPCHPDRVRRNYHEVKVGEYRSFQENEQIIYIKISRLQIASAMSKKEIEDTVFRSIHDGIFEQYKD